MPMSKRQFFPPPPFDGFTTDFPPLFSPTRDSTPPSYGTSPFLMLLPLSRTLCFGRIQRTSETCLGRSQIIAPAKSNKTTQNAQSSTLIGSFGRERNQPMQALDFPSSTWQHSLMQRTEPKERHIPRLQCRKIPSSNTKS